MEKIKVSGLYKIFGKLPQRAFPLLEKGLSKAAILEKTGLTVGINDASFTVHEGEIFVVMGLSGSGKSTVIRCLNRLIRPTRGEVLVDGENVLDMQAKDLLGLRRTKMSMVFQNFGLLPHRDVLRNVEFGLEVSGEEKVTREEKAMHALELVGLKGYEKSMPGELSGGMQQRVGLARAIANSPEILLMDEAFSALDPLIRTQMQDELLELQDKMQKTIVFITHDLDEALKLGDRIAIMKDGAIVQIGSPEEILTSPANDYVQAFVQNVDKTKIITAGAVKRKATALVTSKDGPKVAIRHMEKLGISSIFVTDRERHLLGLLTIDDAVEMEKTGEKNILPKVRRDGVMVSDEQAPLSDLLHTAMTTKYPIAIQNAEGKFSGIVDRATILSEVRKGLQEEYAPVPLSDIADKKALHPEPV
jgi:glycine betaine/proline transport system ATP-binding protein